MEENSELHVESSGRLDKFLAVHFPDWSRTQLQKLITQKNVTVDGKGAKPHSNLKSGQTVRIDWPTSKTSSRNVSVRDPSAIEHGPRTKTFRGDDVKTIFEDEDVLVVNKPPHLVVHPSAGHFDGNTLIELLAPKIDEGPWPDETRQGLVHRLDRDTSGVIIFAKNPPSQNNLSKQFAQRQVKKIYFGLVEGRLPSNAGTLESKIARHPGQRQRFSVSGRGRWALTKYTLKENWGDKASWLEIHPHTGRTHQIRVQLAAYGHPILGDHVYGNRAKFPFVKRQMLHAAQLQVQHPTTKKKMIFKAPAPNDFLEAIKLIRLNK